MKTLVIYDGVGNIYFTQTNYIIPQGGIKFLEVEIPDGKILKSIDTSVTSNVPVYEDAPVSDIDRLKQQVADLQSYIIEKESDETTSL